MIEKLSHHQTSSNERIIMKSLIVITTAAGLLATANHGIFSNNRDIDSRIQQIVSNPPIVQNGNTITIGNQHNEDLYRNISIQYDITLPRASAISASSGS